MSFCQSRELSAFRNNDMTSSAVVLSDNNTNKHDSAEKTKLLSTNLERQKINSKKKTKNSSLPQV